MLKLKTKSMKKLHKKLEKVAEHIDLSNANQTRQLKNLAIACQHYELAASMRGFERIAEQSLAEDSKFNPRQVLQPVNPLDKMLERHGWKLHDSMREDLIKPASDFQKEKIKSLLDNLETNTESLNTKVNNIIGKLRSQSSFILSEADVDQIGEWLSSGGKSSSLITILGDDSDVEKTIDRGMAITAEVLKQGMEFKEAQEEPTLLVNSIKTPDGSVLTSRSRHDYVCHTDKITGTKYCIDGGLDYRRIVTGGVYQDLAVYSDDPFEKIRESLERVHRGKNLDQPSTFVVLKDMNDAWLEALIPWIEDNQPSNKYKKYYLQEIEYRKANGITVKEEE